MRRVFAPILLLAVSLGIGAQSAVAHSQLVATDPQPGATLPSAPAAVTLTFNEAVEVKLGGIKVYATNEQRVDEGRVAVTANGTVVRAPLKSPAMGTGTYVVVWRVASADGHPVQGAYTFNVGAPSVSSAAGNDLASRYLAQSGASSAVGVTTAVGRTLAFSGIALLIGVIVAAALWARGLARSRSVAFIVWAGLGVAAAGSALALLAQGSFAAGLGVGDIFRPDLLGDAVQTRFGQALALRLVLLAVTAGWWAWAKRIGPSRAVTVIGRVLALALAGTVAVAGHAATGPWPIAGVLLDLLHVLAVSAWFGGLVVLAVAALRSEPVEWAAVGRFSSLALISVIVIVVSGSAQGWRQLGSVDALTSTDYGRVLIAKVMVFALVLPFAAYARDLLRRRIDASEIEAAKDDPELAADLEGGIDSDVVQRKLRRSIYIEIAFLVVVFALTAVLVNTVPGREAATGPVAIQLADARLRITGTIAPAALGPNDVHLTAYTPDGLPTEVNVMNAKLVRPDLGAIDIPLRKLSPGHYYSPQFVVPRKGKWTLVVTSDIDAFTRDVQQQVVTIR